MRSGGHGTLDLWVAMAAGLLLFAKGMPATTGSSSPVIRGPYTPKVRNLLSSLRRACRSRLLHALARNRAISPRRS